MININGLNDNQVLQRNIHNVCDIWLTGQCSARGTLLMRVTKGKMAVSGLSSKKIGNIPIGDFKKRITGIPVGGPYDIRLQLIGADSQLVEESLYKNILVGDVWILAGQSNMEGIGRLDQAAKPKPNVRAFYMDDRWAKAQDPIHNLVDAVDPVHADLNDGTPPERAKHLGTGPGIAFGQAIARETKVPQGLICCAHGGTTMNQWSPTLKKTKGKSLYSAMIRRFEKNGSRVAGFIWYQGESDAIATMATFYTQKMIKLVAAIRKDCNNKTLPIVIAQLSRLNIHRYLDNIEDKNDIARHWNYIQEQQRQLPTVIKRCVVVPTIDLPFDDMVHVSGAAQQTLGQRMAQAMCGLYYGKKPENKVIEFKKIALKPNRQSGWLEIEVTFANAIGQLTAIGQPQGFSLTEKDHSQCHAIYRINLTGNKAILKTTLPNDRSYHLNLHYGLGTSPYCNITDQKNRSLPVLGPIKI